MTATHLRFYNYATWQDLTEQLALSDIAGAVFHFKYKPNNCIICNPGRHRVIALHIYCGTAPGDYATEQVNPSGQVNPRQNNSTWVGEPE